MNTISIEKVNLTSVNKLQIICKQTFFDTYSNENTVKDMNEYLEKKFNKNQLIKELNTADSAYYFAKNENEIIGYLKLNFGNATTELKNKDGAEIERIYVIKEHQGKRFGQTLMDVALKISKEKKAKYIWLGVWEKNTKAIDFYKRNKFIAFDKHIFKLGKDKQTDILMKLNIT